jgi:hypothetical protein
MNIALKAVDSLIPNLALMKLSTWHKQQGDSVKLYDPLFDSPDCLYLSKVFDFTPDFDYLPDCEIIKGGIGYDIMAKLPMPNDDAIMPDYELFNCEYALGRVTRGCPNSCPWCVVSKMDGREIRQVAEPSDFIRSEQRLVKVLDDNLMALPDLMLKTCEWLKDNNKIVNFEALDIRLVNDQTAYALASVKHEKSIHFSWDGHHQDNAVVRGIDTLKHAGILPYRLMFYVLIGFNTTPDYDLYRVETLRKLGANPFVMPYLKTDRYQKDFARWCNQKAIFKSVTWDKYKCGVYA